MYSGVDYNGGDGEVIVWDFLIRFYFILTSKIDFKNMVISKILNPW